MCLSIGTPKIINFPFGKMENLLFLGVPILKHITVLINHWAHIQPQMYLSLNLFAVSFASHEKEIRRWLSDGWGGPDRLLGCG